MIVSVAVAPGRLRRGLGAREAAQQASRNGNRTDAEHEGQGSQTRHLYEARRSIASFMTAVHRANRTQYTKGMRRATRAI